MTQWLEIRKIVKNVSTKGFFNLLSANVLINVLAFALQLLVAGILSPDDVGRLKILRTWLSIFSILGSMGFSGSTLKLCSENRTEKEVKSIFSASIIFTLITTIAVYLLILLLNWFELLSKESIIQSLVPLALLPLVVNGMFTLFMNYYLSRKEMKKVSYITSINKTVAFILVVGFTLFFGIKGYYIGLNIAEFSVVLIVIYLGRSKFNIGKIDFSSLKGMFKLHWNYALPSFLSNFLADLTTYADVLIISYLLFDEMNDVGFYSFALTLTVMLKVLPATVQQITIPYFSELSNQIDKFKLTYRKYSRILVVIIAVTLLLVLLIIPPMIDFIFKGKYNASFYFFIPLAVGWSIRQFNQIQAAALFGLGAISKMAKSMFYVLIINVIFIFISLHFGGLIGVAYSSIPCALVEILMFDYYLRKQIKKQEE